MLAGDTLVFRFHSFKFCSNLPGPKYLQPHYGNGVFGNAFLPVGQHCRHPIAVMGIVDTFSPGFPEPSRLPPVEPARGIWPSKQYKYQWSLGLTCLLNTLTYALIHGRKAGVGFLSCAFMEPWLNWHYTEDCTNWNHTNRVPPASIF